MEQHSRMLRRRAPPVERETNIHLPRQDVPLSRETDRPTTQTVGQPNRFSSITITVTRSPIMDPTTTSTRSTPTPTRPPPTDPPTISPTPSTSEEMTTSIPSTTSSVISTTDTVTPVVSTLPPSDPPVPATGGIATTLPSGAVAGIVIAVLIFVLGVGLTLCCRIRRKRASRAVKAPAWLDKLGRDRPDSSIARNFEPARMQQKQEFSTPLFTPSLPQPPSAYGNYGTPRATGTFSKLSPASRDATVKLTFVPTLPDELSLTHGESLQLLQDFDDGWALCVNSSGTQGMVPMECLEIEDSYKDPPPAIKSERRTSSLSATRL